MLELIDSYAEYRNVTVEGHIGPIVFGSVPMPLETAQVIWDKGEQIPLDVIPSEFWSPKDSPFPRFGDEMLGSEF